MLNEYVVNVCEAINSIPKRLLGQIKTMETVGAPLKPDLGEIRTDWIFTKGKDIMRLFIFQKKNKFFGMASETNYGDKRTSILSYINDKSWNYEFAHTILRNEIQCLIKQGWNPYQDNDFFTQYKVIRKNFASGNSQNTNDTDCIISAVKKSGFHCVTCISKEQEDFGFDFDVPYIFHSSEYSALVKSEVYKVENKYGEEIICDPDDFKFVFDFSNIFLD